MLTQLTPVVNFTNILQPAFLPFAISKRTQTDRTEKLWITLSHWKADCESCVMKLKHFMATFCANIFVPKNDIAKHD